MNDFEFLSTYMSQAYNEAITELKKKNNLINKSVDWGDIFSAINCLYHGIILSFLSENYTPKLLDKLLRGLFDEIKGNVLKKVHLLNEKEKLEKMIAMEEKKHAEKNGMVH